MVAATSQTNLGLCVWTVGLATVGWFVRRADRYFQHTKSGIGRREAITKAFDGGARDALVEFIAIIVIAVSAWCAFVPVEIYRDHMAMRKKIALLASDEGNLQRQISALSEAHPKHGFQFDNEFVSISQVLGAFHELQGGGIGPGADVCRITITAPPDTLDVAKGINHLAAWDGCLVSPPEVSDSRLDPDAASKAAKGAVTNMVVIHAARENSKAAGFTTNIGNVLDVTRSYDMPKDSSPDLIWMQFGSGNVWRKD